MGRVQDELDVLAIRLRRSLTLDSPDGELVAHSMQDDNADPARITAILRRRVPPEVRAWEAQHLDVDAREPVPVPANAELGMSARLGLTVRSPHDLRVLAELWLLDTGSPLTPAELAAVQTAALRIADLLGGGPDPAGRAVDQLVRRLRADRSGDVVEQLRAAVPTLSDGVVRLVAVVPTGAGRTGIEPWAGAEFGALANAVTPALRGAAGYVGAAVAADHVLVLLQGAGASDRLLDALDALAGRGRSVTIGLSDPSPFAARPVRSAVRRALAAAELAALDPALPRRCGWVDLGAYRSIVDSRPDDSVLAGLMTTGASAPMLAHTLECYLDRGGDARATAAALSLHRSSLYYRLDRVGAALGVDLADGMVRLDLHLALKARRAARRRLR